MQETPSNRRYQSSSLWGETPYVPRNLYTRNENKWGKFGLGCLGFLVLAAIITIVSAFLTTLVWGGIVPEIFPGLVEMDLLPASITISQAIKLSIFFSFLGIGTAATGSTTSSSSDSFGKDIMLSLTVFVIMIPVIILFTVISGFLITLIWGWVIPDVFSGAVAQGALPASLSLWHSILLSTLFSILGLKSGSRSKSSS